MAEQPPRTAKYTICSFAFILLLLPSPGAISQGQSHGDDYYNPEPGHLGAVERHHLAPAINKLKGEQYPYARNDIDFILRHFPNHPRGLMLAAEFSLATGQHFFAEEHFRKSLAAYPRTASTYSVMGIYLFKRGDFSEAIDAYQKALEINPDSAETHYNIGLAYFSRGMMDEARRHARKAYRLGFPLPGLRQKLEEAGAWNRNSTAKD